MGFEGWGQQGTPRCWLTLMGSADPMGSGPPASIGLRTMHSSTLPRNPQGGGSRPSPPTNEEDETLRG